MASAQSTSPDPQDIGALAGNVTAFQLTAEALIQFIPFGVLAVADAKLQLQAFPRERSCINPEDHLACNGSVSTAVA